MRRTLRTSPRRRKSRTKPQPVTVRASAERSALPPLLRLSSFAERLDSEQSVLTTIDSSVDQGVRTATLCGEMSERARRED
jgi:hypothetical protein